MKISTRQRKVALKIHLESIVAATRAIDEEMRTMPHSREIAYISLVYKKEFVVHDAHGSFRATYRASDRGYYTITVHRESHQKTFLFEEGPLQNISGKAL